MKLNILLCSLRWEMKLNGTLMLGGLKLWFLADRRHREHKLLCELILVCDVSVKKVLNPFLFR